MRKCLRLLALSVFLAAACTPYPSQLVGQPRDAVVREFGKPARIGTDPETGRPTLVYWNRLLEKPEYRHEPLRREVWTIGVAPYAAYFTVVFVLDAEGRVAKYHLEDEKPYRPNRP